MQYHQPVNAAVAVKNTSKINITMMFDQEAFVYPGSGKVKIVPYVVALQHFGFEIAPSGQLYRNTANEDESGEETQYHAARASFLPWGWMNDETPVDKRTLADGSMRDPCPRKERFDQIRDAWENHITGKLVSMPREMSSTQFDALPA